MTISTDTTMPYGLNMNMIQSSSRSSKASKLNDSCRNMEALFIQNMLKEMRATIPKSGLLSGGNAESLFTSMLDAEMAKSLSAAGGIGLSSVIENQLDALKK